MLEERVVLKRAREDDNNNNKYDEETKINAAFFSSPYPHHARR